MKDQLLSIINEKGLVSTDWGPHLLKLEQLHDDSTVATIFLDYDQHISSFDEAISRQEKVVSSEFFKSEGSHQWNFYYYFILGDEEFNKVKPAQLISQIENDMSYSRKRVISLSQLKDSYPFSSILQNKNDKAKLKDLTSEWINVLKENDLDEVYMGSTYDAAIDRYLEGKAIKEVEEKSVKNEEEVILNADKLESITLKKYRGFLENSVYKFGKVNLIEGVNGKGKTSLLEGIELALCGKTYRNEELEDAEISLKIFNEINLEKYNLKEAKALKKYKDREMKWYGIPPGRSQNKLHYSFNRFNFFNTDASFRFSMGTESEDIWESFSALALGSDATELDKRIKGFEGRFNTIKNKTQKEHDELLAEIKKLMSDRETIEKHTEIKEVDITSIKEKLAIVGNFQDFEGEEDDVLKKYQTMIGNSLAKVRSLLSIFSSYELKTLKSIDILIRRNQLMIEELKSFDEKIVILKKKISDNEQVSKKYVKQKVLRERLRGYLNSEAFNINKIENEIIETNKKMIKAQSIVKTIRLEDLFVESSDDQSLFLSLDKTESEIKKLSGELEKIEKQIEITKKGKELYRSVVVEIKDLGKKYLEISQDSHCPMCASFFSRNELEERINNFTESIENLDQQISYRRSLIDDKKKNNDIHQNLLKLKRVIQDTDYEDISATVTIKEIKNYLKESIEKMNQLDVHSQELEKLYSLLKNQGFSSSELHELSLELQVPLFEAKDVLEQKNEKDIAILHESIDKILEELKGFKVSLSHEANNFFSKYPQFRDESYFNESIPNNFINYSHIANEIESFQKFTEEFQSFNKDVDLWTFQVSLDEINESILTHLAYLSTKKQQSLALKQIIQSIAEKQIKFELLKGKLHFAKKGVETFTLIDKDFNKEHAINKFFELNKVLVLKIFKEIHTPNEFDNISINEKEIFVYKNGVKRGLNTISTGQRTAVALSLFLGMHMASEAAPKIILFDDPMAFVDDLNVLAFLDFLRELVIKGDRQIFFATANEKLSSLFKRKFEVLGLESLKILSPECKK